MIRPELRPLGVGEIIDAAIKLVRGNARVLFTIAAVVLVPLGILQAFVTSSFGGNDLLSLAMPLPVDPATDPEALDDLLDSALNLLALTGLIAVTAAVGAVLVQGASVKALADIYQGVEPEWPNSITFGFRRFFSILGATLMIGVASALGLIFCIAPGVWLFTSWSVTMPALVVEHKGAFAAMGRSFELVRRRFWPTLGTVALAYLVYYAVEQVISLAVTLITFAGAAESGTISLVGSVIGSTISSILVLPFLAAVLTVLYFDLRVRAEGYDLEVMAAELGVDGSSIPPPVDPGDPFGLGTPGPE
ncbi:MAG TPA: hypothetical protein VM470_05445 [Acidimicrobiia bacterium]|nr:hypothetical protein [Acidimicrobiia bacterium]